MMIDRSIIAKNIKVTKYRRIVAISDIHANLPVFKKLLHKIKYDPDHDELFLVGDLLEKGKYNMETLHFIMNLSTNPHVHPMMGNCDFVCKNILFSYRLDFLKEVLLSRNNSILHEMAHQLQLQINEETDMEVLAKRLIEAFPMELNFINSLPHVIETQDYIFGHAAILDEKVYGEDMRDVMTHNRFLQDAIPFKKYVIVGHLPVSEYCQTICSFNPFIDTVRHIICIDGGNEVKHAGQLNALLIKHGQFTYAHSDSLEKALILKSYLPDCFDSHFITWHDSMIHILHKELTRSYCEQLSNGKKMWIPNELIFETKGTFHAENFTTYQMPVHQGDFVKIITTNEKHALIKKNGQMGWIPTNILKRRT